jgi:hypothetical protein
MVAVWQERKRSEVRGEIAEGWVEVSRFQSFKVSRTAVPTLDDTLKR